MTPHPLSKGRVAILLLSVGLGVAAAHALERKPVLDPDRPLTVDPSGPTVIQPSTGMKAAPARQEYRIPGIQAWSTARRNGWEFYPLGNYVCNRSHGEVTGTGRVTTPRNGVDTRLIGSGEVLATVVGGNMVVYPEASDCSVNFQMFATRGRGLADGWTVKRLVLQGSFTWRYQPEPGSSRPEFRIRVDWPRNFSGRTRSVIVRELVLEGPAGQSWARAFQMAPTGAGAKGGGR